MATFGTGPQTVYRGTRDPVAAPTQSIDAAQAPWNSLEQSAAHQVDYEDRVKKAQQTVEATQAGLEVTRQLDDLHSEYKLRNDYGNFAQDFATKSAAIKANVLGQLQDPEVAQHVGFEFDKMQEAKKVEIENLRVNKMQDAGIAALDGMEDQAVKAAAISPPEEIDALKAKAIATIHGMHAAGILGAADAEKRILALGPKMELEAARADIAADPAGFDPNKYQNLSAENRLALSGQAYALKEHIQKDMQEKTGIEFTQKMNEGTLTQDALDTAATAGSLDYQQYKDMSHFVTEGDGITHAPVFNAIVAKIDSGQDATDDIAVAVKQGQLKMDDYVRLADRNKQKDSSNPMGNPITRGRDYVRGALGGLAAENDEDRAPILANAVRDYDIAVEHYADKHGKVPEGADLRTIMDEAVQSYDTTGKNTSAIAKARPYGITNDEVQVFEDTSGKRMAEQRAIITRLSSTLNTRYLQQYQGNDTAAVQDPDYLEQYRRIKRLEASISAPKPKPAGAK